MRQEFAVHLLNDVGLEKAAKLGEAFSALLDAVDEIIPETNRERSIVVTKLQEASFFAKRAIALRPEHQKT